MVWVKRIGFAFAVAAVVAGGFATANRTALTARYTAYRFQTANTDDDRIACAVKLLELGEAGAPYLVEPFAAGDESACIAVAVAMRTHLTDVPPTDPRYAAALRPFLDVQQPFAPVGAEAALALVPLMLKCPDAEASCRELVRAGLSSPTAAGRVQAIRLTLTPQIALKAEVAPLLDDPDAAVRRAAVLTVGPQADDGAPAVDEAVLFRRLHDADEDVRELADAALRSRGLDAEQIAMGAKLVSPEPADRLRLLLDLRSAGDTVRDPGPWLERLGRDPDPAVRAGAVRVGFEARAATAEWAAQAAETDPDPTVRRLAGYYRGLTAAVQQAGAEER